MNTFLPYQSYRRTAACLDRQRLGKQRVEVLQILRAINGESRGWRNHPAVRMWDGHIDSLVSYGVVVCDEWIRRGYRDTCRSKILAHVQDGNAQRPPWLTRRFCLAHRSNLLRKNHEHYSQFGWNVPADLPYVWPKEIQ